MLSLSFSHIQHFIDGAKKFILGQVLDDLSLLSTSTSLKMLGQFADELGLQL